MDTSSWGVVVAASRDVISLPLTSNNSIKAFSAPLIRIIPDAGFGKTVRDFNDVCSSTPEELPNFATKRSLLFSVLSVLVRVVVPKAMALL